jgi:hypothetical protein
MKMMTTMMTRTVETVMRAARKEKIPVENKNKVVTSSEMR